MVKIGVHAELGVNQENFSPVQFCQGSTTQVTEWLPACCHAPLLVCFTAALTVPGSSPGRAKSGEEAAWHCGTSVCWVLPVSRHFIPQIPPPYDSERYCRSRSQEASNSFNYSLFFSSPLFVHSLSSSRLRRSAAAAST